MEEKQENKGYLTEKYVDPEVVFAHGSIDCPSTLHGTFSVNGFKFRMDGWHTVNAEGRLYVSLLAYTITKKSSRSVSSERKRFKGFIEEVTINLGESARVADKLHPVEMRGALNINEVVYDLKGRAFITQAGGISIEFLIFAPRKR